jgi:DeoR/GlpR family transcriptional regulator of sugar metabolism
LFACTDDFLLHGKRHGCPIRPHLREDAQQRLSADTLIMGILGITAAGISDSNSLIVESIRAMIKAAHKVIIVADHSKFERDAMIHVAGLGDIDQVVTDHKISPAVQKMLKENDVECVIAF